MALCLCLCAAQNSSRKLLTLLHKNGILLITLQADAPAFTCTGCCRLRATLLVSRNTHLIRGPSRPRHHEKWRNQRGVGTCREDPAFEAVVRLPTHAKPQHQPSLYKTSLSPGTSSTSVV